MAEAEGEQQQKAGKKKFPVLAIAAVVLIIACGAGGYFLGTKHTPSAKGGEGGHGTEESAEGGEGKGASSVGPLLAFDDIVVNLLDDQEPRYLKVGVTLELDGKAAMDEATARKAQIKDAIILLLSNRTFPELRDQQGKLQLRADLMEKINGFLQKGKVTSIFFTDFVVQ